MVGLGLLIGMSWSQINKAEVNWQLKIDRKGIQVFQSQQTGYSQKHSKGIVTVKAQPEQLLQLIADLSICDQWLYGCLSAEALDDGLIHMVFKGPLWFKDRDVIMSTTTQKVPTKDRFESEKSQTDQWQVITQSHAAKHINKKYVRINHTEASWLITSVGKDQVQISYELYIDPEISLKRGVNKYNRDAMFLTLRNLRNLLDNQN